MIVEEPTQGRNILDLFLTNNDSLVQHTTVKPGIGDRDVEILCNAKPQRVKTAPHRAFLWKKVDFKAISDEVNKIDFTTFCLHFTPEDVGSMWSIFHSTLFYGIKKKECYKLSKITSSKPAKPWINTSLKRRKKRQLCRKARLCVLKN